MTTRGVSVVFSKLGIRAKKYIDSYVRRFHRPPCVNNRGSNQFYDYYHQTIHSANLRKRSNRSSPLSVFRE